MAIMKNAAVYFCDALGNFPGEENGNLFSKCQLFENKAKGLQNNLLAVITI